MIKTNDKVVVNNPKLSCDAKSGVVINTYNVTPDNVAIVRLETDETVKVAFADLIKIEPNTADQDTETVPEGARRITEVEYYRALDHVTDLENQYHNLVNKNPLASMLGGMTAKLVGSEIGRELFENAESVTLTADQFVAALWKGCSPHAINESVGNSMKIENCLEISISAIVVLRGLVKYLYTDGSENA